MYGTYPLTSLSSRPFPCLRFSRDPLSGLPGRRCEWSTLPGCSVLSTCAPPHWSRRHLFLEPHWPRWPRPICDRVKNTRQAPIWNNKTILLHTIFNFCHKYCAPLFVTGLDPACFSCKDLPGEKTSSPTYEYEYDK